MVINEFPIGQKLNAVSSIQDQEFSGNELCFDQIKLFFEDCVTTLLPIVDTDEIEIIYQYYHHQEQSNSPDWCRPFLDKKLMNVWVCENAQQYQDQIILALGNIRPSLAFVSEGSVIKVFTYQQLTQNSIISQEVYMLI